MADISSLYPQPNTVQPVNALDMAGKYVGIKNALTQNELMQADLPIRQQQLQHEQMQNQLTAGRIKTGQVIAKNTKNGKTNWLGVLSDSAQDPDTANQPVFSAVQDLVNNQLQQTSAGVIPQGQPNAGAPQSASLQNVNQMLGGQEQNQGIPQDRLDELHSHSTDAQQTLVDLLNTPDSELTTRKLMTTGVDMIGRHATSNGKLGHNSSDVAAMISDPGFPEPNAKPEQIRNYLMNKYNQSVGNQAKLTTMHGPPSAVKNGQPQIAGPTMQTANAPGVVEDQAAKYKHFNGVQDAANSVPQENAALNNILNISKSGAETGTMIGQMYAALSKTGLVPQGVEDAGAQLALIKSHAAQLVTADMPGSNDKLHALESAKIGDKDLPEVIQGMVPYLLAVNEGKVQQAAYYRKKAGNGLNPVQVTDAQSTWNKHFDPRILEMRQLQSDPTALKKYISGLSKQDKEELSKKYQNSKEAGILGQ